MQYGALCCAIVCQAVDCGHTGAWASLWRLRGGSPVGLSNGRNRSSVAVVITTDGRRVHLPMNDSGALDVTLSLLRSLLLGLEDLVGLITGSRRENGGSRRIERR